MGWGSPAGRGRVGVGSKMGGRRMEEDRGRRTNGEKDWGRREEIEGVKSGGKRLEEGGEEVEE